MQFSENDILQMNKLTLELIRQNLSQRVSSTVLASFKVDTSIRYQADRELVRHLSYALFGIKRQIKREKKIPADWWNAIKLRFSPKWLLEKFPVCYETILTEIEVTKICPHLNIPTAEQKFHIAWLADNSVKENDWLRDKALPEYLQKTAYLLKKVEVYLMREQSLIAQGLANECKTCVEILKENLP